MGAFVNFSLLLLCITLAGAVSPAPSKQETLAVSPKVADLRDLKLEIVPNDLYVFFHPHMFKTVKKLVKGAFEALGEGDELEAETEVEMEAETESEQEMKKEEEEETEKKENPKPQSAVLRSQEQIPTTSVEERTTSNLQGTPRAEVIESINKNKKKAAIIKKLGNTRRNKDGQEWKRAKRSRIERDLEDSLVEAFTNALEDIPFRIEAVDELKISAEANLMLSFISQRVVDAATRNFLAGHPGVTPQNTDAAHFEFLFSFFLKDIFTNVLIRALSV